MANISQIKLPNGDTHNFIDTASGYTKNTGTITGVKTTAGAHTTIDVTSGAVTFKVPTKTSHLTNDSGFKTTDTNTTYSLSGALSSHKFTSTLTAGGSGSGTSTSELTFAAGTGITLTDDATNKKITIAASHNGTVTSVAASGSGGITISGSPITSSGTITIGLNLSTAINGLGESTSPATINDYAVVQYAGGGTTTTTYHRRKLSNLIVGKAVADQNGLRIDTGYLKLTGGNVTGPTTFGDTVSIDDLNAGQLVVSGSASFANNLQVSTINGVAVGNSPKFTDTVTTATTTGSGNAVTAITASNGALTVTKGTTFLTSHNTYTVSTTGTGNAVTAVSLSGTTFTVTKGATYSNNAGTITSVKTTAGAHTAINTTSGAVSFNVPTTAAHVGIKFGYTTSGNNRAVLQDSSGNLYVTQKDDNTTYSSKAAASGGTDVSLVTTGEKYTWNSKTSNTGTITSVKTTAGAHTAINVTSGAANFNVPTTAAHVGIKFGYTTSGNNRAVLQDSSGNLYVTQKDDNSGGTVTSITLTQGAGISIGSSGTAITTSGTRTIALATSGVTAGTYGAVNESRAILGGYSTVDELGITVDKYGRVTDVKVKPLSIYAGDILCANAASSTSTSVTSTITQIPLTQTLVGRNYHSNLSLASNRIAITTAGTYRITGSIYITTTKASSVGVYIMKGSGAFSNATEIASSYIYVGIASSNSINVTKIIQKTSTTAEYIYLAGRASAGGTVASGNVATYLEVEELRF